MLAANHIEAVLSRYPASRVYWIAYSGGLDSTVLLHLCAGLRKPAHDRHFKAIHVHHGLQPLADAWVAHCETACRALGIELHIHRVNARPAPGQSPEEAARKARHQAFQNQIEPGDTVLLAQHQDDQAETLLLQLFRGAGLAGLAAMPVHAPLVPGYVLRPLLDVPRSTLRAFAETQGLDWVEDSSNLDPAFERNFLRNTILPELRTHWPGLARALSRTARHCAEAVALLDSKAGELLKDARRPADNALNTGVLNELVPGEQKLLLRAWLKDSDYRMPSAAVLDRILEHCLEAGTDRNPIARWTEGEVRRYREHLYLLPPLPRFLATTEVSWPEDEERLKLPGGNGELIMETATDGGIPLIRWQTSIRTIRYRQGGEKIRLPGRDGTHELRKLFQEAGIPPWIRERVPLIYLDDHLAAVGGFWLAAEVVTQAGQMPGLLPRWIPPAELVFPARKIALSPNTRHSTMNVSATFQASRATEAAALLKTLRP